MSPEIIAKEKEKLRQSDEKKEKLKSEISEKIIQKSNDPKADISINQEKKDEINEKPIENEKKEEIVKNESSQRNYMKFDEKMKSMMLKKRQLMDDMKKITDEDINKIDENDENPVVKNEEKKKSIRGIVQKTKGVGVSEPDPDASSESEEEDFLTNEQKYF